MVSTAVVVANWPMLVTAVLHVVLMNLKAANEERYLKTRHGPAYADYSMRVGRFFPARAVARGTVKSGSQTDVGQGVQQPAEHPGRDRRLRLAQHRLFQSVGRCLQDAGVVLVLQGLQ